MGRGELGGGEGGGLIEERKRQRVRVMGRMKEGERRGGGCGG